MATSKPSFALQLTSALILLAVTLALPEGAANPDADRPNWMQVEETVVPLKDNTTRNANILGFAHKGQVLAVEKFGQNWVKVRANDTLSGWVPIASLSASGPPVNWSPDFVKDLLVIFLAVVIAAFLFLGISLQMKRKAEGKEKSKQALADAKRRLQNKIQLLFTAEPSMHSHLASQEVNLLDFLRNIGYVANLEKDVERFLGSCKSFKPNLILAGAEFREAVEKMVETDAMLINTPVVYLRCDRVPLTPSNRIRAYLEQNANDKELADAIALCLRKSPEKIRYSVKPVALKGSVHTGTLMELLHFISAVKKTGQLLIVSGQARGEILFHKGEIAKASVRGMSGAAATEAILNLSSGSFEFYEKATPLQSGGSINTQKLLLDWAKNKDESNHHIRT